jgi:hypothetical protein
MDKSCGTVMGIAGRLVSMSLLGGRARGALLSSPEILRTKICIVLRGSGDADRETGDGEGMAMWVRRMLVGDRCSCEDLWKVRSCDGGRDKHTMRW